jgi:hypothetical protein
MKDPSPTCLTQIVFFVRDLAREIVGGGEPAGAACICYQGRADVANMAGNHRYLKVMLCRDLDKYIITSAAIYY